MANLAEQIRQQNKCEKHTQIRLSQDLQIAQSEKLIRDAYTNYISAKFSIASPSVAKMCVFWYYFAMHKGKWQKCFLANKWRAK